MKEQKGFSPIIGVAIIAVIIITIALLLLVQKRGDSSIVSVINNKTGENVEIQQTTSALDPVTANSELDKIDTSELDAELNKLDADTSTF